MEGAGVTAGCVAGTGAVVVAGDATAVIGLPVGLSAHQTPAGRPVPADRTRAFVTPVPRVFRDPVNRNVPYCASPEHPEVPATTQSWQRAASLVAFAWVIRYRSRMTSRD